MTTLERSRRRLRFEQGFLLILALLMVIQTAYFHHQDNVQQRCVEEKISALTTTLTARGKLADRDSRNTSKMILAVSTAKTASQFEKILKEYKDTYIQIEQDRKDHPVPPYPPGSCGK
jgi:hypothetical protein